MDFALSPELEALRSRVDDFVTEHIMPLERDRANYDAGENIAPGPLAEMRAKARAAGLWAPQMPVERGGLGLDTRGMAVFYEAAGRSIFGPVCFNCAPPDDGNMLLLNWEASEAQKDRWLQPIIDGAVRSALVMTEPAPGAGSDPAGAMLTRAERKGDRWIINGHKWFITGADAAAHFIVLARTSDDPRRNMTTFLFHHDDPGWEIVRRIPIMGPEEHGGHCELRFDDLEIPDENRLLEVGAGMRCRAAAAGHGAPDALHALARHGQARARGMFRLRPRTPVVWHRAGRA